MWIAVPDVTKISEGKNKTNLFLMCYFGAVNIQSQNSAEKNAYTLNF